MNSQSLTTQSGFNLVEVTISLLILSAFAITFYMVSTSAKWNQKRLDLRAIAILKAQSRIEKCKSRIRSATSVESGVESYSSGEYEIELQVEEVEPQFYSCQSTISYLFKGSAQKVIFKALVSVEKPS